MPNQSMNKRLLWLLQISRNMLATRELEQLLTLITDAFIELTEANRGILFMRHHETGKLTQRIARNSDGSPLSEVPPSISTVAKRVLKQKKPIYTCPKQTKDNPDINLMVSMPFATNKEVFAVVYVDGKKPKGKTINQTCQQTCEMLAEHSAAAIENARIFQRATNDHLTGLPNNNYFLFELAKEMREATDTTSGAILLLDLDNFKRINIAGGPEMGDRALIDVGQTLQDNLRADGLVSRYGSDKFGILLPVDVNTAMDIRIRDVAERARASVGAKTYHGIKLSASIGGLIFPTPQAESAPDVVTLADKLLGEARHRGIGEIEIHT